MIIVHLLPILYKYEVLNYYGSGQYFGLYLGIFPPGKGESSLYSRGEYTSIRVRNWLMVIDEL